MKIDKTCAACGKKFRDHPSEPFSTCHECRKPDRDYHPQNVKLEPRAFRKDNDDWEDLLMPDSEDAIDWDDIHRAYEDNQ